MQRSKILANQTCAFILCENCKFEVNCGNIENLYFNSCIESIGKAGYVQLFSRKIWSERNKNKLLAKPFLSLFYNKRSLHQFAIIEDCLYSSHTHLVKTIFWQAILKVWNVLELYWCQQWSCKNISLYVLYMRALHQTELCHYKNLKQSRYHVFSDIILKFRDQNEEKKKKALPLQKAWPWNSKCIVQNM